MLKHLFSFVCLKALPVVFLFVTPLVHNLFPLSIPGIGSVECCLFMSLFITQFWNYVNCCNSINFFCISFMLDEMHSIVIENPVIGSNFFIHEIRGYFIPVKVELGVILYYFQL